jgi:hypothetical protein
MKHPESKEDTMREATIHEKHTLTPGRLSPSGIFTLKITLIEGPVTYEFARRNPEVSRTIRIYGDRTLHDLHREIFRAFDRQSERPFEFQFDNPSPTPGNEFHTLFYTLPTQCRNVFGEHIDAGDATNTRIDSLPLAVGDRFHYWFDFFCEWLHRIEVLAVEDGIADGGFVAVVERIGDNPPQFPEADKVIKQ